MSYNFSFRIKTFSAIILFFAIILVAKLFFVQVIESKTYKDRADRQYATPSGNIFERGSIYFTGKNGDTVTAAVQTTGFKVAINPVQINDTNAVFNKLKEFLPDLDYEKFKIQVAKKTDPYEEIGDHLAKDVVDKISALKIPGVSVYKEKWRFYPGGDLASHTLGFVGFQGNDLAGRYGLEREFNDTLAQDKNSPYVNFFAEVFSNINKKFFSDKKLNGDIVTSIEPRVEDMLEQKLSEVKEKYNIESVGGIIMNPSDGTIYAMSAKPDFDPNNFSIENNNKVFSNPLVENVFEFGSVVKPLVMAAGLDRGVVTASTTYNDKGEVTVNGRDIYNFDKKGRGANTPMQEVLNQSLNTGMVYVAGKLGHENVRNYLLSYGIGEKTGIDLPNETHGLVSNILTSPRDLEYAQAAFGQGIAVTPVEMIRALASLGNGGNLVVPHVVKYIKYDDGTKKEMTYPTVPTKISQKTSEEISRMLVNVMDKAFQQGKAKFEHYTVAMKTGTAQLANPETKGYYQDRYTHSFFGYFPAYDPKFIVFLYAVDPKGVPYASQTWGEPFLDITKFLINYYEVPPDR